MQPEYHHQYAQQQPYSQHASLQEQRGMPSTSSVPASSSNRIELTRNRWQQQMGGTSSRRSNTEPSIPSSDSGQQRHDEGNRAQKSCQDEEQYLSRLREQAAIASHAPRPPMPPMMPVSSYAPAPAHSTSQIDEFTRKLAISPFSSSDLYYHLATQPSVLHGAAEQRAQIEMILVNVERLRRREQEYQHFVAMERHRAQKQEQHDQHDQQEQQQHWQQCQRQDQHQAKGATQQDHEQDDHSARESKSTAAYHLASPVYLSTSPVLDRSTPEVESFQLGADRTDASPKSAILPSTVDRSSSASIWAPKSTGVTVAPKPIPRSNELDEGPKRSNRGEEESHGAEGSADPQLQRSIESGPSKERAKRQPSPDSSRSEITAAGRWSETESGEASPIKGQSPATSVASPVKSAVEPATLDDGEGDTSLAKLTHNEKRVLDLLYHDESDVASLCDRLQRVSTGPPRIRIDVHKRDGDKDAELSSTDRGSASTTAQALLPSILATLERRDREPIQTMTSEQLATSLIEAQRQNQEMHKGLSRVQRELLSREQKTAQVVAELVRRLAREVEDEL